MKKITILILLICPCIAFSQAIHLPDAYLPKQSPVQKETTTKVTKTKKTTPVALKVSRSTDTTKALVDTVKSVIEESASGTTTTITTTPAKGAKIIRYSASVLNTNFTIPLVRVNFLVNKPTNASNSLASTSFFNSIGAGLNYSWGELDQTLDSDGNSASVDYYNHFGFQFGFLFAANSSTGKSTSSSDNGNNTVTNQSGNIFALVGGISILNFQLGAGYELGSLTAGQRRGFVTLSYAIPMSLLIKGGYKIFNPKIKDNNL